MFFKQIVSEGLAHFSYMVGDGGQAVVIDPRRDVQIYLDVAMTEGLRITHILETHRNEDCIAGSMELAEKTGATIYVSAYEDLGYVYGEPILDGQTIAVGKVSITARHTPGHTLGHMSYVLYENDRDVPYLVFSGDSLFMGDLGRTDFYGEARLAEMTGLMYDSVFQTLLPLGDQVLLFPAHGAGSACGDRLENRPYSTLGYERLTNAALQVGSKEAFIKSFARMRIKPRYFEVMETANVKGAPFVGAAASVPAVRRADLHADTILLDIRSKEAFIGGHIEGSYFLSTSNLSTYLGTLFDTNTSIVLITPETDAEFLQGIRNQMLRIGFDHLAGYLEGGIDSLLEEGKSPVQLATVDGEDLKQSNADFVVLDIRDGEPVPGWLEEKTIRIPLQELYKRLPELPQNKAIYVLCASGNRSATACSFLNNHGFNPYVILGGIHAVESES